MSKSLLHDWESSIEKNKNNTEELLKIAEDIYNTAYARGKASTERPEIQCPNCLEYFGDLNFCPSCGARMRGKEE